MRHDGRGGEGRGGEGRGGGGENPKLCSAAVVVGFEPSNVLASGATKLNK